MSIIDDYIEFDKKYKKQHGNETVILMEVGDFFELYGVQNEYENVGANLQDISDILNIRVTSKNKSKNVIDRSNPLMSGFPSYIVEKHIQTLVENQYTVVLVEQYENKNCKYYKQFDRKVSRVITPSTYLNYHTDNTNYANYLMVCYWETIKHNNKDCLSLGCTLIDITTGKTCYYECTDKDNTSTLSLEEAYRISQMYNPTEVVHISFESFDKSYQRKIVDYLHSNTNSKIIEKWNIDKIYSKIRYQEECIKKSYSKYISYISPIDTIKMEMKPLAIVSFCYMLQYIYEHDETLINNLYLPTEIEKDKHMSIEYNSIQQLNIKNNNKGEKCLSKILNRCLTTFGKRQYWDWLINPIINIDEMNTRYNNIEFYLNGDLYVNIRKYLKMLCDIQKYLRRISIDKIVPSEWNTLMLSFNNIVQLLENIQKNNHFDDKNIVECLEKTNNIVNYIKNVLSLEECVKYNNMSEIKSNIFNFGIYPDIDNIQTNINSNFEFISKITEFIDNIVGEKEICKLENNDKQGYYLTITKKRWELFTDRLKIYKKKKENNDISLDLTVYEYKKENNGRAEHSETVVKKSKKQSTQVKIHKDIDFDFDTITVKPISASSTSYKILSPIIEEISNMIISDQIKIQKEVSIKYFKFLQEFYNKYENSYTDIIRTVSEIDIYCTNAMNADEYSYNKPTPVNNEYSYLIAKDMRHPIVERIQTQNRYIENDITLGISDNRTNETNETNNKGMLLYGVNSSGKSTMMKSVGLNVIMAQAGMYVPCSSFVFSPYKHLFTRISGSDNIYKGMSSFTVEMTELKNILDRCNKNSLILGDELCSGTESVSALAIVASGILDIISKNANFIFATHLHELCDLDVIKDIHLQVYHIHVSTDNNGNIIFDRKLTSGKGSSVYGLEICKYLKLPDVFLKNAEKIRKQLMDVSTNLIETKSSKYNSNIIVSSCGICGLVPNGGIPLDTHHIVYQQYENDKGYVKINNTHHHKNQEHNLIPLCKSCHDKEHNGNITIKGFIETTGGRKLLYDVNDITSSQPDYETLRKIISFDNNQWKQRKTTRSKWKNVDEIEIVDYLKNNIVNCNYEEIISNIKNNLK